VIYTRLLADPAYRPNPGAGDRSMRRVLERFGLGVKLKSLFLQSGDNNQAGDCRFPMSEGEADRPFILTRRLPGARTAVIRDYGRAHGVTINDMVLTALYRSLFRLLDLRPRAELAIPVMVDMRRYLANGDEFTVLTNLSSTAITRLKRQSEEAFAGTLSRVKTEMDAKKGGDTGLNAFVKLNLLYRLCGDRIANRKLRTGLKNPLICMTNIGVLDAARLSFGDLRPTDAYLCGSIKYKPYFQLAMSSYQDELTDPQRQSLWKRQRPSAHPFLPRGYRCGIAGGISVEEFHKQLQGALIPAHGVIGTGLKSSRVYRRRAPASTRRRAPIWSRQERTALPSRRWSDQK
jgi:NRPS condensation-like uncharacterized protein